MVEAGTTRLYCVEAGQGRPVVLVGGWPQSIYCWRHVLPVLAQTHRVIALDPPGLGDSEKPAPAYDMEAVAANLHAALDTLRVDVHDFVGFDIGMWVGYPFAAQRPERVRTLTLVDARIPGLVPWAPMNPASAIMSWHLLVQRTARDCRNCSSKGVNASFSHGCSARARRRRASSTKRRWTSTRVCTAVAPLSRPPSATTAPSRRRAAR